MVSIQTRCRTSSRSAVTLRTNCLAQPGVGLKRAAQLLRRYGTLDGVLDAGLFAAQGQALRLYRLIATMDAKAPRALACRSGSSMERGVAHRPQLGAKSVRRSLG